MTSSHALASQLGSSGKQTEAGGFGCKRRPPSVQFKWPQAALEGQQSSDGSFRRISHVGLGSASDRARLTNLQVWSLLATAWTKKGKKNGNTFLRCMLKALRGEKERMG